MGATSEVGLEAARQLLATNVIIGARNITKAEDVKQESLQSQMRKTAVALGWYQTWATMAAISTTT